MPRKKKAPKLPSASQQQDYTRKARLQYGGDIVNESVKRWQGYGKDEQQAIMAEGAAIYQAIADALVAGKDSQSEDVQALMARWHDSLRHFYEPTLEILRGLGQLYHEDADFSAFFRQFHPDMTAYLRDAIGQYVDDLEDVALARLLDDAEGRLSS